MDEFAIEINGLSGREIVVLYNFTVDYENQYKDVKPKEFVKKFPRFKCLESLLEFDRKKKQEMKEVRTTKKADLIYMTESKQLLTFLKHLRNAFAHSQLIKNNEYIELIDYSIEERTKKTKKEISAYGVISNKTFEVLINYLTNINSCK